jgi:hypothetical protein
LVSCGGASACIADTDNVLLTSATDVKVGSGETNTTPAAQVQFTSTTDRLNLDASGQATISAVDQVLNSLTFDLLGGFTFERAEFNLFNGADNPLSVTLLTNTGSTDTFDIANANGANRFGITAAPGELLTGVTFTSAVGFDSLRQLRLGGISAAETPGQTGAVPEPATWAMMLMGFGAVGFGMRRRKSAADTKRLRVAYA